MTRFRTSSLWWGTLGLLAVSAMMNVAQAHRLRGVMGSEKPSVLLGKAVRPVLALDQNGRPTVIRFDRNVPTVLYFFSPTCGWCERNWENVRAVAEQAEGRYRVVGIAAETSLGDFAAKRHLSFEVYGGVSEEARNAMALSGTPRTIVVSAQGLITHDWTGAFSGSVALAVEGLFGLELPGLRPAPVRPTASR